MSPTRNWLLAPPSAANRPRMYELLPYFFLAVAGRRLPMLAERRVEQKSNKGPQSGDFHNNLFTGSLSEHQTKPNRTGPHFLLRLSRRWVRVRGSDLLPRLHQHRRILLLRLSARWRTFNFQGSPEGADFPHGRWDPVLDAFSCVKQSKRDVTTTSVPYVCMLLRKLCLYF